MKENFGGVAAQISFSTPLELKNYWTDFQHLFTQCRAIGGVINAHICKAMVHFLSEHESKE